MNRGLWTLVGFLFFVIGFSALVLSLVGVQFSFLTWLDKPSRLFGFVMRLVFILLGFVIVYLARTDWKQLEDE
ncbi:MAG: hypothetical protein ACJAYJ_005146 [Saprospiraceae bacterium]|jgi:hypothetical protein